MSNRRQAMEMLETLFSGQYLGVLATQENGQPHTSLVAFLVNEEFSDLVFATERGTRKYINMKNDGRVAFLIDSRSNRESDFHDAIAVTAYGMASDLVGDEADRYRDRYMEKFPSLKDFVQSPTCALMGIRVKKYAIVSTFQNVVEYFPAD